MHLLQRHPFVFKDQGADTHPPFFLIKEGLLSHSLEALFSIILVNFNSCVQANIKFIIFRYSPYIRLS